MNVKKNYVFIAFLLLFFNASIFTNKSFASIDTYVNYKVQDKDTFYKISESFKIDVNKLIEMNSNITPENLQVGQVIKVPAGLYKIESDITISEIAEMFNTSVETIVKLNQLMKPQIYEGDFLTLLNGYDINQKDENIVNVSNNPLKKFMFKNKTDYEGLYNSYNAVRTWSPNGTTVRGHEGIDIMSEAGTPIYAVADGTIARYGWNTYGGWRLNILLDDAPYYTYYAHMSSYAKGMYLGKHVKAGELIGYVGNTGYGPQGTSGKFDNHLHFGMYDKNMNSLSPFDFLVDLENKTFGD